MNMCVSDFFEDSQPVLLQSPLGYTHIFSSLFPPLTHLFSGKRGRKEQLQVLNCRSGT